MSCHKCQKPKPQCKCRKKPDPCYQGGCDKEISTDCVIYKPEGGTSALSCFLGIGVKAKLTAILEAIDRKLCDENSLQLDTCTQKLLSLGKYTTTKVALLKVLEFLCTFEDSKVKVTPTDKTSGYLIDKISVGDCLKKNVIEDYYGNQKVHVELDFNCIKSKLPTCLEVDCNCNGGGSTDNPVLITSTTTVCGSNLATLTASGCSSTIEWWTPAGKLANVTGNVVTLPAGTYFIKCGTKTSSAVIITNTGMCNCSDTTWTNVNPSETRCVNNITEVRQISNCGNYRWTSTGNSCGCTTVWASYSPVQTSTGCALKTSGVTVDNLGTPIQDCKNYEKKYDSCNPNNVKWFVSGSNTTCSGCATCNSTTWTPWMDANGGGNVRYCYDWFVQNNKLSWITPTPTADYCKMYKGEINGCGDVRFVSCQAIDSCWSTGCPGCNQCPNPTWNDLSPSVTANGCNITDKTIDGNGTAINSCNVYKRQVNSCNSSDFRWMPTGGVNTTCPGCAGCVPNWVNSTTDTNVTGCYVKTTGATVDTYNEPIDNCINYRKQEDGCGHTRWQSLGIGNTSCSGCTCVPDWQDITGGNDDNRTGCYVLANTSFTIDSNGNAIDNCKNYKKQDDGCGNFRWMVNGLTNTTCSGCSGGGGCVTTWNTVVGEDNRTGCYVQNLGVNTDSTGTTIDKCKNYKQEVDSCNSNNTRWTVNGLTNTTCSGCCVDGVWTDETGADADRTGCYVSGLGVAMDSNGTAIDNCKNYKKQYNSCNLTLTRWMLNGNTNTTCSGCEPVTAACKTYCVTATAEFTYTRCGIGSDVNVVGTAGQHVICAREGSIVGASNITLLSATGCDTNLTCPAAEVKIVATTSDYNVSPCASGYTKLYVGLSGNATATTVFTFKVSTQPIDGQGEPVGLPTVTYETVTISQGSSSNFNCVNVPISDSSQSVSITYDSNDKGLTF